MAGGSGGARSNGHGRSMSTVSNADDPSSSPPYIVRVTTKFLLLSLASSILLAFTVGRAARIMLYDGLAQSLLFPDPEDSSMWDRPDYHALLAERAARAAEYDRVEDILEERAKAGRALPEPVLGEGKEAPRTVYSSKNFDTAASGRSSTVHMVKKSEGSSGEESDGGIKSWKVCRENEDGTKTCTSGQGGQVVSPEEEAADAAARAAVTAPTSSPASGAEQDSEDSEDEEEEEHLPAGQHLLVDIKNVDAQFLNSEERLARAMVDVIYSSELTLLSYHCHSLLPAGVSCVGVLLESHVSFHTWPEEGVITLDLFTCGSKPLVPAMPLIESKFAIPIEGETDPNLQPHTVWCHKLRGFANWFGVPEAHLWNNPLKNGGDLGHMLGHMDLDMKRELVSIESIYQRIDIYEVIHPRFRDLFSYHRSLEGGETSYESLHPELYRPDRIVYLDGVMQSSLYGDAAYHESLVHPGMFAHPNPKRVAIIGGGEGATLREVLKHNTVERATMIEIDEQMVKVSREYIPTWSDCSDLDVEGGADWCVDDKRADVRYEDALAWFTDRFGGDGSDDDEEGAGEQDDDYEDEEPFDVIIMDALDPQDNVPFAEALYDNVEFLTSLKNGMSDDGVIVMQLGESPMRIDPPDTEGRSENRGTITRLLEEAGFESLHVYEEGHSDFQFPWSYLVAFKSYGNRALWYRNSAEIELAIRNRVVPTKSGGSPLKYFDGATMVSYQVPHKTFEHVFCYEVPVPEDCEEYRGFDPKVPNAPASSSFEVKRSGPKGFGLYAKVDIPEGTLIAAETSSTAVKLRPSAYELIDTLIHTQDAAKDLKKVATYMHVYGFQSSVEGSPEYTVDSGILTFVNHGCNGTENMGSGVSEFTEATIDLSTMPERHGRPSDSSPHHIVLDRHLGQFMQSGDFALRDIKAGEEIMNNYLDFTSDEHGWEEDVREIRSWCGVEKSDDAAETEDD